ncbi:restriction endonuclease subunit S [Acinetobacter sp. YH12211]|uniref:restriction endonuclease subunit S n=1 Tax=Acinetobacter sp. YH12211 TaxID=2601147 RepID=UPI0015D1207C|nr:restriction endonuclease subunit S [Acinetobacter sp. YH12211]
MNEQSLLDLVNLTTGKLNSNAAVETGKYPFFTCSPETLSIDQFSFDTKALLLAGNNAEGNFCLKYYEGKFDAYQRTYVLTLDDESVTTYKYLFYYLKTKLLELKNNSAGSATRFLTLSILRDIRVPLPPLPEQKAIASVLSSLDDKIDLLHRQNKTLEAMAETLFRQWFIEEAKEDWEYVELGSVVETSSGGTPSRKEMSYYESGSIHWVKSKELNGSFITETEEMITDEAVKRSSAKLLPAYSTLIAMYGATVGEYALITKTMTCNQAVCALKENEAYPYTFIFMYVKNQKDELINQAVGSAQQNISQILIKKLPIPTCIDRINEYHQLVNPWFKRMQLNVEQIQTLENLRDTLLPKLMSGEVRIQYQTEEVA